MSLLALVCSTISLSLAALVLSPFDRRGERVNAAGRLWAALHLKACGVTVSVEGLEHLPGSPHIFMCNHQSTLDIFALLSSLDLPFKWMAKRELFSIPFLGFALRAGKNIPVDREHPRKAVQSLKEAALRLREGAHIVMFPEGTWSTDGSLLPFKKGGFSLALRTDTPIIPVGIRGTGPLQPEGCLVPRSKGLVTIRIGSPVAITEGHKTGRDHLISEVRNRIRELM